MSTSKSASSPATSQSVLPSAEDLQATTPSTPAAQDDQTHVTVVERAFGASCKPDVFPFLKLPAELRNMVYRIAFRNRMKDGNDAISLRIKGNSWRGRDPYRVRPYSDFRTETMRSHTGLLRVNKQVHQEGLSIFFSVNEFGIYGFNHLRIILELIGTVGRSSIRDFTFFWRYSRHKRSWAEMEKAFSLLGECTNLQNLQLGFSFFGSSEVERLTTDLPMLLPRVADLRLDELVISYFNGETTAKSGEIETLTSILTPLLRPGKEVKANCMQSYIKETC